MRPKLPHSAYMPYVDPRFSVKKYGAVGNGLTDDTVAINAAIDACSTAGGGTVYVPAGDYLINSTDSILLKSNIQFIMHKDAILRAIATSAYEYEVIYCDTLDNVRISGGQIIGDRDIHTVRSSTDEASDDEYGMGIKVWNNTNLRIDNIKITKCQGDGIYVGSSGTGNFNDNVLIEKFESSYNRRNGITLISQKNTYIRDGLCDYNNNSTFLALPRSGIEFEPNTTNDWIGTNVWVDNITAYNNGRYGIWVCGWYNQGSTRAVDVHVNNYNLGNNGLDAFLVSDFTTNVERNVYLDGAKIPGTYPP